MQITKASEEQIQAFISQNEQWSLKNGKLHREFQFADFVTAFGFMTEVAIKAESQNHHPEWFNVYRKVVVDLTTHEAGGISSRDFKLAQVMDEIASGRMA